LLTWHQPQWLDGSTHDFFWQSQYTRWFKYDRDKLWLVYTQSVPVIFEPPCRWTVHITRPPVMQPSTSFHLPSNISLRGMFGTLQIYPVLNRHHNWPVYRAPKANREVEIRSNSIHR
jgi:hypothetical protein